MSKVDASTEMCCKHKQHNQTDSCLTKMKFVSGLLIAKSSYHHTSVLHRWWAVTGEQRRMSTRRFKRV